jgi:NAD(P)-dependent dehydrogenase (short-subunit alcohol dehydrogenase family)
MQDEIFRCKKMNPSKLNKKIVLITGSTKSIGAAMAKAFMDEGAIVIVSGRGPIEEERTKAISAGAANYVRLDVGVENDWQDVTAFIQKTYGKLDILINNAGISELPETNTPQDPVHTSLNDWRKIFSINVDGIFLGCKYSIPLMKTSEDPCIINIGSRSGLIGVPLYAAYAASKATIANYTKTIAAYGIQLFLEKESAHPIRCVEIQAANIHGSMWDFGGDKKKLKNYVSNLPLRRMGEAAEVAALAVTLATNKYISGSAHLIDGGIMATAGAYPLSETNAPIDSTPALNVPIKARL